jgi:hypothetical protein
MNSFKKIKFNFVVWGYVKDAAVQPPLPSDIPVLKHWTTEAERTRIEVREELE